MVNCSIIRPWIKSNIHYQLGIQAKKRYSPINFQLEKLWVKYKLRLSPLEFAMVADKVISTSLCITFRLHWFTKFYDPLFLWWCFYLYIKNKNKNNDVLPGTSILMLFRTWKRVPHNWVIANNWLYDWSYECLSFTTKIKNKKPSSVTI